MPKGEQGMDLGMTLCSLPTSSCLIPVTAIGSPSTKVQVKLDSALMSAPRESHLGNIGHSEAERLPSPQGARYLMTLLLTPIISPVLLSGKDRAQG